MKETVTIVNPLWYIKKAISAIRQEKKISKLEEEIKKYKAETEQIKIETKRKIEDYKIEVQASLDTALEEENKRKEVEKELQKKLLKTQEQLDKYCTNPHVKSITGKSNREIETLTRFIPPERKEDAIIKKSHEHPREQKYSEFLNSLKRIPYVTHIIDKEAKEAKFSKISRIEVEEILLIYVRNSCGYRVTLKTTAQNICQQHYIAELVKNLFDFS